MKLIVGLGNPGRKYQKTRHNVGFEVIAELGRRHGNGAVRNKFQGDVLEATVGGQRALLLGPQTYMNNSGASVQPARDFYKLELEDLIVICDDFHLPVPRLRFRAKGSSGGQKGLQDIIRRLGTEEFTRLRIGVGPLPGGRDVSAFVLSKFTPDERVEIDHCVLRAADAVADWAAHGTEYCMNHYNAS